MNKRITLPESAMLLAAGLGTRMRPITETLPKPLVRVFGKTLLDHNLDALARSGVARAVVNVHHLADQVEAHLAGRTAPQITISDERGELRDSGGGIKKALCHLGEEPFFVLNADSFWLDGSRPNLHLLAEAWNPGTMDILLLLSGMSGLAGYDGSGDFEMDAQGRLTRRRERRVAPFVYAGAAILNPAIFRDTPDGRFSLNLLFDRAIGTGRLHGARMDGLWLHVGTPEAIHEAELAIARSAA